MGMDMHDARTQTERAHRVILQCRSSQSDPDRNVERGFASPGERGDETCSCDGRDAYLDVPPNPRKL